jgi:hypothetical protein
MGGAYPYMDLNACIILESNLEFEHAKGPTCLKYLHSSTGILSLIISQLQRSSIVKKKIQPGEGENFYSTYGSKLKFSLSEYFNFLFTYLIITYYSLQFLSNGDTK